jgi:DNA polymerase-3 subunit alpha
MKEFVHLHNHTEYSLLDGCARIKNLVQKAVDEKARAVAITDHGNVYGAIKFYKECLAKKIKPILGIEAYYCDDIKIKTRDSKRYHLILLAKDINGFHNIMKMSSVSFVDGFYEKPRIDGSILEKYHEGVICLSACIAGEIPQKLLNHDYKGALTAAQRMKNLFGDDFYIELQYHGLEEEREVFNNLKRIAYETGAKTVATNDIHYVKKTDAKAHDILLCIQTASDYDDPNRMRFPNDEFYYKNYDEMLEAIKDEEPLDNTLEIADKCNVNIEFHHYTIPHYEPPEGFASDADYLRKMTFDGLKMRYGEVTDAIRQRAEYELDTIITMGFASYYLIVWDFIHYAKNNGIPVGAGRGSGVGSIVAYAIRITEVDPLKYDLIFERFLNSSRQTMPDFDVDFCSDRREEVIEYVRKKYHPDHVAQIITFGTMKKKNAIKNVARVFKIPFAESNALVKNIRDNDKHIHICNLIDRKDKNCVEELADMYENNSTYKEIIDLAMQIEDMPKDRGKHAAGVIICSVPVSDVVALSRNDQDITTQFDMTECEELGLLKMDFLALKTLTDINMTVRFLKKYHDVELDFNKLGYEDQEVYKMIGDGDTDTVFQLESGGMKDFMRKLKPTLLEEIIAGVSLYRPGPMSYIPAYISNKFNPDKIDYGHPRLVDILKNTYGIVVYQEQAMRITQALAGYTLNEADNFRKFISKKKTDQTEAQKKKFMDGCLNHGVDEKFALDMWMKLQEFGKYAFNKSHAAAYSVLTYQTAFLKHYYPIEYLCSVINNRITSPDDTSKYLRLIKEMNIELLQPDINHSYGIFVPEGIGIRYGLACIKNVGHAAVDEVVAEREKNGEFKDFSDFARRVNTDALNKRMIESLIKGGAFDCFGHNRATLMANYEKILETELSNKNLINSGQIFFDFMLENDDFQYTPVSESKLSRLKLEKEVLGRYVTGHPLEDHEEEFKKFNFNTTMLTPIENEDAEPEFDDNGNEIIHYKYDVTDGQRISFGGILSDVTVKISKSNKKWGFATIEDYYGSAEITFFGNTYTRYKDLLVDDSFVKINGRISISDDRPTPKIEVQNIYRWGLADKEITEDSRVLCIKIDNDEDEYRKVSELLQDNIDPHGAKVKIQVGDKLFCLDYRVMDADGLKSRLIGIVGYNNVKILS